MKTCPQCGQPTTIWARDLASGVCRKCVAAQKKADAERIAASQRAGEAGLRAGDKEFEERFKAEQAEAARQCEAEQERQLRSQLRSKWEQLRQEHRRCVAVINALDDVDAPLRDKLLEAAERRYLDEVLAGGFTGKRGGLLTDPTKGRLRFVALVALMFGALLGGVVVYGLGLGTPDRARAEDRFRAIADAKEQALRQFLESKNSSFSQFKATMAEEKEDVQKRATYPYTGKIEFHLGIRPRVVSPDGKSSFQDLCQVVAVYRYSKKDRRWECQGCSVPGGYSLPPRAEQLVDFDDLNKIFRQ